MIHSARPTVSSVENIVFIWNLICYASFLKSGEGRTEEQQCENNDDYGTWLWVGRVDQKLKQLQVGDVNVWNLDDTKERFYPGKTSQIHRTHLSVGDRLWSTFPNLRPLATVIGDSIQYGFDEDGAGVHDVIGTRCDQYTYKRMTGKDKVFDPFGRPTITFQNRAKQNKFQVRIMIAIGGIVV